MFFFLVSIKEMAISEIKHGKKPWVWNWTLLVAIGILILPILVRGVDKTKEKRAVGKDVVEATLLKIHSSKIFKDDRNLLLRIAWVESRFGTHENTFRNNYHGGIWQVDLSGFEDTQATQHHPELVQKYKQIKDKFGIDWPSVTYADLEIPLYSGIAARLLLSNNNVNIPGKLSDQGEYWKEHYNSKDGKGTPEKFINDVNLLEKNNKGSGKKKSNQKQSIVAVLDGSGSIGSSNFQLALDFVGSILSGLNLQSGRFGFIVYSNHANAVVPLTPLATSSKETEEIWKSTWKNIHAASYPSGGTNTAGGIFSGAQILTGNGGSEKDNLSKIMYVLTDGQSNDMKATLDAASNARSNGITIIAVAIGTQVNQLELIGIQGPGDREPLSIDSFKNLGDILNQLSSQSANVPLELKVEELVAGELGDGEKQIFKLNSVPEEGLYVNLGQSGGNVRGFYSYEFSLPSDAVNDGVLKEGWQHITSPPRPPPELPQQQQLRRRRNVEAGRDQVDPVRDKGPVIFITVEGDGEVENRYEFKAVSTRPPEMDEDGFGAFEIIVTGLIIAIIGVVTTVVFKFRKRLGWTRVSS